CARNQGSNYPFDYW
nr:immunoglobulin heavy chain junction region [Mus musculus]